MTTTSLPPAAVKTNPVLPAALLGFFLIILDTSAVNVGLDAVGAELGGGLSGLQWVVDGYTLLFGALMLSAGALSDRIGARRGYAAGLAAFTLASIGCALAPRLPTLIGARVLQGAAAAVLLPASLALVRQGYADPARRARAVAIWTAGGAAAIAAGPAVGGLLTSVWSWRWIFGINVPVGLVALVLLSRTPRSPRRPAALDLPGQLTAVLALVALTFALIEGGHRPVAAVSVVVALIAGAAFVRIESRTAEPMLPLGLFRSRTVSAAVFTGFVLNAAYYGTVFVLSLFVQRELGLSAAWTGLMFVPMSLVIVSANLVAPRLASRYGARGPIVAGQVLVAVALLLLLTAPTSAVALTLLLIPVGLGAATVVPLVTTVLLDGVAAERAGLAAGVFNAARQVGGGLAIAVFGSLAAHLGSFRAGLHAAVLIGAAALVVAAAVSAARSPRRRRGLPG